MNFGYFLDRKVWIQCSRLGHYSEWDIIQDWDIIQIITVFEKINDIWSPESNCDFLPQDVHLS